MQIQPTSLPGVFLIDSEKRGDSRGYLVRTYCEESFLNAGLNTRWIQSSITRSPILGTLRGMHFQEKPHAEIKLIRCITGAIWDCLVDVRPDSPTYGKWESFHLSEENSRSLYVPQGIAHGFLTLSAEVRLHYSMSAAYSPDHATGIHWNDPDVAIQWPETPVVISEKDQTLPRLSSR